MVAAVVPCAAVVSAAVQRFDMAQFQPQADLPAFTPRFNFDSEASTLSTSSSQGPDAPVVCSPLCANSEGIVVSGQPTTTATSSASFPIVDLPSLSFTGNNTFPAANRVTASTELDRSNMGQLYAHLELFDHSQRSSLRTITRKQQLHPQRYRHDYLAHSSILLLSPGWSSATRYGLCSVPNQINRSGQCKLHKFCPYCAWLEQRKVMARYVNSFHQTNWFWLTITFHGDLSMDSCGSYYDLPGYWDAGQSALRHIYKDDLIDGAFVAEELAVNRIAPSHTLPHLHSVIAADELTEETIETLRISTNSALDAAFGPDHLLAKIHVRPITSQHSLVCHLQYAVKPISIVRSYRAALDRIGTDPITATQINSQTTDLVLGYSEASKCRQRLVSIGSLDSKAKTFIGTKTTELKAAGRCVDEVLRAGHDAGENEQIAADELPA